MANGHESIPGAAACGAARPGQRRLTTLLTAVGLGALLLTGCGGQSGGGDASASSSQGGGGEKTLRVSAAASLTTSFDQLSDEFEKGHPGVTVDVNYGGSSGLVQQLIEGAAADVFASADQKNMKKLMDADLAQGDPKIFATNVLTLVVPRDNPAGIESFQDVVDKDVKLVTCAPEVPCGAATKKVEKADGVELKPVSQENAVTDVLGKVTSGQADAGIVYVTDAKSAGDKVTSIDIPKTDEAVNNYPVVALKKSEQPQLATEFVDLVTGERGQEVLKDAGFGAP
ncbi:MULTISPECIES: molybdate ABC transporter substrate-binding protein [Kocuria]|uniref:molybdate ABC transporter substrate-binding protein n=1 Tax=Kocuria TaxID=57493 RepID=UPI0010400D8F|nr:MULTISPECIES: molybdate ABC transporter substrate-binding protein [Kocuria]QBJ20549.1 molybdate ABC transporter substrate-binding protein [Kocuria indica]QIR68825.1 molybdate ABC transporter substrate-binding protein [Kocuria sp. KD4]